MLALKVFHRNYLKVFDATPAHVHAVSVLELCERFSVIDSFVFLAYWKSMFSPSLPDYQRLVKCAVRTI